MIDNGLSSAAMHETGPTKENGMMSEFHGPIDREVTVSEAVRVGPFVVKLLPSDVSGDSQVGVFLGDTVLAWVDDHYADPDMGKEDVLASLYVHLGNDDPEILHHEKGETA